MVKGFKMKVSELIEKLKEFDGDLDILCDNTFLQVCEIIDIIDLHPKDELPYVLLLLKNPFEKVKPE
jgi:hypothetical protein